MPTIKNNSHDEFGITVDEIDNITNLFLADIKEAENRADQLISEAQNTETVDGALLKLEGIGELLKKRIDFEKELFTKVAEDTKINLQIIPFMRQLTRRLSKNRGNRLK